MYNEPALVIFSGGQDSTTCLFWAKQEFTEVHALSFRYGQKHEKEVELARAIAAKAGVDFQVMDAPLIGRLGHNALTDATMPMDSEQPAGGVPNTFVPGRNLFFLAIAAVHARERGIRHLVTGVSQTDFSGYPDCRDSFIDGRAIRHPHPADVARQGPDLGVGRPPGRARPGAPRHPDVLQRHPRRRMRPLPRLQAAPRRTGAIPRLQAI